MLDWEADSPVLGRNLASLLRRIRDEARRRDKLKLSSARNWHREIMDGLAVPNPAMVGGVRVSLPPTSLGLFPNMSAGCRELWNGWMN